MEPIAKKSSSKLRVSISELQLKFDLRSLLPSLSLSLICRFDLAETKGEEKKIMKPLKRDFLQGSENQRNREKKRGNREKSEREKNRIRKGRNRIRKERKTKSEKRERGEGQIVDEENLV